jgi:hypothetical protein
VDWCGYRIQVDQDFNFHVLERLENTARTLLHADPVLVWLDELKSIKYVPYVPKMAGSTQYSVSTKSSSDHVLVQLEN